MFCRLVVREIVQQDRAQDGTLGFDVGREAMRKTVIGGRQNFFRVRTLRSKSALEGHGFSRAAHLCESAALAAEVYFCRLAGPSIGEYQAKQKNFCEVKPLESMAKPAQNKCGPGQPPGPHCSWMPRLHLHRARR